MLKFLSRRLKNQKGAMDKILVTLLLVVIGVGAVIGLSSWVSGQTSAVETAAEGKITEATTDTSSSN